MSFSAKVISPAEQMRTPLSGPHLDCISVRSASRSPSQAVPGPLTHNILLQVTRFVVKCDTVIENFRFFFFLFFKYWYISRFRERLVVFFHSIQPSLTGSFDCISSTQKFIISGFLFLAKNVPLGHQTDVAI